MSNLRQTTRSLLLGAAFLAASVPAAALAAEYEIDASHSSAGFSVRHLMVSNVKGQFNKVTGTLSYDAKDLAKSSVQAVIDVNSIDTNEPKRDEHLKSPDFFDAKNHPNITFKSKKFAKAGKDKLKVTGDLTIRGVTKEVVLDVEGPTAAVKDPWGQTKMGATATTKVNRQDYGLKWNQALETGGVVVGDDVKITLELEFTQKAAAPATAKDQK